MTTADESLDMSLPEEEGQEREQSVTDMLEQLGHRLSALVFYETRLAAARHRPEVRRAARDVAAALAAGLAFLTAFALANAAAVRALSTELSPWLASLVLAAAWAVLGVLLALFVRARARRIRAWDAAEAERARAEAEQAVRETLEQLSPALSKEIALAAVPAAGDMAGGVVDAGEELIESADEIVETLTENVPGGSVVNQMWDVVLVPGRLGIRVATTVLRRGDSVS
jgi:small-conductance mechanosensitive channel